MTFKHIIDAANAVHREGKKPTVALVKAKLQQPTHIRDIIETLKIWRFSEEDVGQSPEPQYAPESTCSSSVQNRDYVTFTHLITNQIESLLLRITQLESNVAELKNASVNNTSRLTKD